MPLDIDAVLVPTSAMSVKHNPTTKGFNLDGDEASPGANKVYGTDGAGAKGWKNDPSPSGGGEIEYEAEAVSGPDVGCFVRATAEGVTYARTGGAGTNTEGVLTIPDGAFVSQVFVHFDAAQAPGNTFYLNVDTLGTSKEVNGSQNSARPAFGTVSTKPATFTDGTPATSYVNSGTPLILGVAQMSDNGTRVRRRIKIENYSQQAGANASILALWL